MRTVLPNIVRLRTIAFSVNFHQTAEDGPVLVSEVPTTELSAREALPSDEIDRALLAYRPESRFLNQAWYTPRTLLAFARPFDHPYHEPWVKHFTREHAVVYATQVSYLLIASAIERGDFTDLTQEEFLHCCRSEEALISSLDIRFLRRAPVPERVEIAASMIEVRHRNSAVFVRCQYRITDIVKLDAWLTAPCKA
ncbi:MAG: hypothetical protein RDU83_13825 [bacterium]|nr:hypothetical protein [bacterium]